MILKSVMTGTKLDRHGERMSLEALQSAAEQVNGERVPQVGVEHDPTLPPIGRIFRAEIEPAGDGEYNLVGYQEIFDEGSKIQLHDGTLAVKYSSHVDMRPFVTRQEFSEDGLGIAYDGVNFASNEDLDSFMAEVTLAGELKYEEKQFIRKSVIPDPEFLIGIAKTVGAYLVGKKVLDKLGGQIADDVGTDLLKLYRSIKATAFAAAKYCVPKNRPITYVFIAVEEPLLVEFAIQTAEPQRVADHLTIERLEKPIEKALEFHKTLGAEKVQYILHDAGTWDLNYILTNTGGVIGTPLSLNRRSKRMKLVNEARSEPVDHEESTVGPVKRAFRKRPTPGKE